MLALSGPRRRRKRRKSKAFHPGAGVEQGEEEDGVKMVLLARG